MLREKLAKYNLILASGSPRRQEFFKGLHLDFKVEVRPTSEQYPEHLQDKEITNFIAEAKADAFDDLGDNDLVVTSDTIVWLKNRALGKPKTEAEAIAMLRELSGQIHEVITSVCFRSKTFKKTIADVTKVWFKELTEEEINFYVTTYQPFDKAGSYGIQEWIGYIGVKKIEGSYFNVMGFPTEPVYKVLSEELPLIK